MRKKVFGLSLCAMLFALSFLVEAQQLPKVYRIGFLAFGSPPSGPSPNLEAFRQRLRELGYMEGQNMILEPRYAKGNIGRLPHLAAELVRRPRWERWRGWWPRLLLQRTQTKLQR